MDARTRCENISNAHYAASLSHFEELLAACKSANTTEIERVLGAATMGRPDGRYVVAVALATAFLHDAGLADTAPGIDEAEFTRMLAGRSAPLFDALHHPVRLAAARDFLLAFLADDDALQLQITDVLADLVLHGLAELVAHIYRPAPPKAAWELRLEGIGLARMMRTTRHYAPIIAVARRREPGLLAAALHDAVGDDADERFLVAVLLSLAILVDMGVEGQRGRVQPGGPQVEALLPLPPEVTVMDPQTYHHRRIITRRFLGYVLVDDAEGQLEMSDEHGDMLLHGLCEWAAAICPARNGHDH